MSGGLQLLKCFLDKNNKILHNASNIHEVITLSD